MGREPDRPFDRREEVDGAEREEHRQKDVLELAALRAPRPPELLEQEEQDRRAEAGEPDEELPIAKVLGRPGELDKREHEDGRERRKADVRLPSIDCEVVVACVVRGASGEVLPAMQPRVREERVVVVHRVLGEPAGPRDGGEDPAAGHVQREGDEHAARATLGGNPAAKGHEGAQPTAYRRPE